MDFDAAIHTTLLLGPVLVALDLCRRGEGRGRVDVGLVDVREGCVDMRDGWM